jgi:hypothetical protein
VTPLAFSFAHGASDASARAAYWQPLVRYLHANLTPSYRIEVVDTVGHWEADYLPRAGIPIARGWFRQDDFPLNQLFYRPVLSRKAYLGWLHEMGVRYVVLTDAPTDYSARAEARLLRSGRSGLQRVATLGPARIFAVPDPRRIVTGPGDPSIVALGSSSVTLRVSRPASYRLAIRYSPYLASSAACAWARSDGMTEVRAQHAGLVRLRVRVGLGTALAMVAGGSSGCQPMQR